jgi:hypothetical protein
MVIEAQPTIAASVPNLPSRQPYPVQVCIWSNVLLLSVGLPLPEGFPGGSLTLCFIITCLASLCIATPSRPGHASVRVLVGLAVVLYGSFVFIVGPCTDSAARVISSAISFVAMIWAVRRLANAVRLDVTLLPVRHVRTMLILVAVGVLIEAAIKGLSLELRVGGIYRALATAPLLFYAWKAGRRLDRIVVLACGVPLMAFASSSTLLVMVVALFTLHLAGGFLQEGRRGSALAGFIGVVILVAGLSASPLITPTIERITGVMNASEEDNISSLVYVNGWQLLMANMESSGGVGIGFNAMGCEPRPITFATTLLDRFEMGHLNVFDGSFLVSKIGSELGVPGLLVWLIFPWLTVRLAIQRFSLRPDAQWLCYGWLAIISIGALVRSTGYFTGTVTLGLLGAFLALRAPPLRSRTAASSTSAAGEVSVGGSA